MALRQNIVSSGPVVIAGPSLPWKGLISLAIVFAVWGSTYLGIRIAVSGGGFPPFSLGGYRLVAAGLLMLGWAVATRRRVLLSRRDLAMLALSGLLFWVGGNGLVVYALTLVPSGYGALIMGTMPIFAAVIDAGVGRRMPPARAAVGLALGLAGIAVLSAPQLDRSGAAGAIGLFALACAACSWAIGSVVHKHRPPRGDAVVNAGWVLLFGGLGFSAIALLRGEPAAAPTREALAALGYLTVVGSVVGFGCYVVALRELPPDLVMTHAYVNPVVAVILGWAILGEPLSAATGAGAVLVLVGVYQVFRGRVTSRSG
jgi:drug/metabolite transporter (DMT)-like permease